MCMLCISHMLHNPGFKVRIDYSRYFKMRFIHRYTIYYYPLSRTSSLDREE